MKIYLIIILILVSFRGISQEYKESQIFDFIDKVDSLISINKYVPKDSLIKSYNNDFNEYNFNIPRKPNKRIINDEKLYGEICKSTVIVGNAFYFKKNSRVNIKPSTGYIIDKKGLFISNNHVARIAMNGNNFATFVYTYSGEVYPVDKIIAKDTVNDIAIFKIKSDRVFQAAPIKVNPCIGEEVYSVHHPKGLYFHMTTGKVSCEYLNSNYNSSRYILSLPFANGSSGGGIFDKYGNIVATIASSKAIYEKDLDCKTPIHMVNYYCVPAKYIKSLLKNKK